MCTVCSPIHILVHIHIRYMNMDISAICPNFHVCICVYEQIILCAFDWQRNGALPDMFTMFAAINKSRIPKVEDVCCSWTLVWLNDVNGSLIFASKNIYHLLRWRSWVHDLGRIDRELVALERAIHDGKSRRCQRNLGSLGCVQLPLESHTAPMPKGPVGSGMGSQAGVEFFMVNPIEVETGPCIEVRAMAPVCAHNS